MSLILSVSILIRFAALVWSLILLRRLSDGRMAFVSAMLALMALRQTLTLITTFDSTALTLAEQVSELPGLAVSILAFLAVVFLGRILSERQLANEVLVLRTRQQQGLAELGQLALGEAGSDELMSRAVSLVHETLRVDYTKLLELLPDGESLLLRVGLGWKEGCVGSAIVGTEADSQAGYTLRVRGPVVVEDLSSDARFNGPALLRDHGVVSGMSVIVGSPQRPIGVLGAHTTGRRTFSEDDINFLQSVANLIGEAIEHRHAEDDLRIKDTALETSINAIVLTDADWKIFYVNRAFLEMWRFESREEILGSRVGQLWGGETGAEARVVEMLARDGHWVGELSPRRKDGSFFDALVSAQVIRDRSGEVSFLMSSFVDISERKRVEAEHEQLRAQFLQAQKLESIGVLAGGIAHDFNNLLTAIFGYSEVVLDSLEKGTEGYEAATEIFRAAESAADLTRQLLAFSRKQPLHPRVLDLNAIVSDLDNMLARLIGENIELRLSLSPEIGLINADATQLEQVIVNLVVNAHDAMPAGGAIEVATARAPGVPRDSVSSPPAAEDAYVRLSISDTGEGMDDATKEQIFEPFFTTKATGKGTGLGLSTVFGIVSQSGGFMRVQSAPGQGSTFDVFLPEVTTPPTAAASVLGGSAGTGRPSDDTRTVLVVEDDRAIRELTRRTLEAEGHVVLVAADGADALRASRDHPGEIDVLLTDVVMPGMTGVDLAGELLGERPGLEVVYMSGYANRPTASQLQLPVDARFLAKPFALSELKEVVRGGTA